MTDSVTPDASTAPRRRMSMGVLVAIVAGIAAAVGVSAVTGPRPCERPVDGAAPGICIIAPDQRIAAPTDPVALLDVETGVEAAEVLTLGQDRAAVTVLNVWASWCGPCRAEQPLLNTAFLALPDGVAMYGISVLDDSTFNATAHMREFDVPYASAYDPDASWAAAFGGIGARTIPSTIILDADGRVAVRIFGEIRSPSDIVATAEALLAESSQAP